MLGLHIPELAAGKQWIFSFTLINDWEISTTVGDVLNTYVIVHQLELNDNNNKKEVL